MPESCKFDGRGRRAAHYCSPDEKDQRQRHDKAKQFANIVVEISVAFAQGRLRKMMVGQAEQQHGCQRAAKSGQRKIHGQEVCAERRPCIRKPEEPAQSGGGANGDDEGEYAKPLADTDRMHFAK